TRVDLATGKPVEELRRMTDWTGFCIGSMSSTADGKQLVFTKWTGEGSVYLADLQGGPSKISTPVLFTNAEARYRASAWTADGTALIYLAKRHGKWGIYRRSLDQDTATAIVPSLPSYSIIPDENLRVVVHTDPSHGMVLYSIVDRRSGSPVSLLMRAPVEGG